jgi:hypothetical protein
MASTSTPRYGKFTPFGYVNLLRILSCTVALYCLVYFYHGTRRLPEPRAVESSLRAPAHFLWGIPKAISLSRIKERRVWSKLRVRGNDATPARAQLRPKAAFLYPRQR